MGTIPRRPVAPQPTSGPVADYTQQGSSDEQWTVLVADGDQRTLTAAQVAELYASGTVGFETLVWKDGIADWQAIPQTDAPAFGAREWAAPHDDAARSCGVDRRRLRRPLAWLAKRPLHDRRPRWPRAPKTAEPAAARARVAVGPPISSARRTKT